MLKGRNHVPCRVLIGGWGASGWFGRRRCVFISRVVVQKGQSIRVAASAGNISIKGLLKIDTSTEADRRPF